MTHAAPATSSISVDPSNEGQLRNWDGKDGDYWATNAELFDACVAAYDGRFLEAAHIEATDRVLDIGCGNGATTRAAARLAPDGFALGVDLSARMIEFAREMADRENVRNAAFEQADAQIHPFVPQSFDVAVSRTGAMFFGDPVAAFANIARALRPGGRLALLVWQSLPSNEWMVSIRSALAAGRVLPVPPPDAPTPFSMADPDRVRTLLEPAGFSDIRFDALEEQAFFGPNVDTSYNFLIGLAGWMLDGLDDDARSQACATLRQTIEAHRTDQGVMFGSATWLITARHAF
jgi:SAM-dependent methyltransferase